MKQMLVDYDHLLNIDYDAPFQIPPVGADTLLAARPAESLNGQWRFTVDVFDTFLRKKLFDAVYTDAEGRALPVDCDLDDWEKVDVPSCWNLQKEKYYYFEGSGVYTRTFHYTPRQEGERVYLYIGAANYECRVFLNGKLVGRHIGGFTPFNIELTGHLQTENRICLVVNNTRRLEGIPSLNFDWFNYGGVTRDILLLRVPPVFVRGFSAALVPDGTYSTIEAKAWIEGGAGQECVLEIPELGICTAMQADETGYATARIPARPELWSCESPRLYDVCLRCGEDALHDRVGFREVRTRGKEILLNGKPIFLRGACCHEESTTGGHVMDDEERRHILQDARDMGCNVLRLTHYPHDGKMARLADEMGMLLWEEIPVYWALCFSREETYQNAENQLRELLFRDANRASVILWAVGNENPDTDERLSFMSRLADTCRTLDPTRLVTAACLVDIDEMRVKDRLADCVDVVAFNEYYGWYYRDYNGLKQILDNTHLDKPMVISETGAGSLPGHHGGDEELFTEEHQAKVYRYQFALSDGRIQGVFPWVLYDFRSPVRLHPMQDQHNRKGLIAFDKKHRKLAFHTVQAYYRQKQD